MAAFLSVLAVIVPNHDFEMERQLRLRDHAVAVAEARFDPRRAIVRPYRWKLLRMARCESTGRWFISTGNGYYGGLQFDLRTWWSVGGRGYPHQNSILEQMYRAVLLILRRGYAPWPICGYV